MDKSYSIDRVFAEYQVFDIQSLELKELFIKRSQNFHRISAIPVIMLEEESAPRSQPNPKRREENEDKKVVVQRIDAARVRVDVGCVWRRRYYASPTADGGTRDCHASH